MKKTLLACLASLFLLAACGPQHHHGNHHGVKHYEGGQQCDKPGCTKGDCCAKKKECSKTGKKCCQKKCSKEDKQCCQKTKQCCKKKQCTKSGPQNASAKLLNTSGAPVGHVDLKQGPNGVLANIDLHHVPTGWHGIHIHGTGDCTSKDFTSAGGHASSHHAGHGFMVAGWPHAGDMPNIWANHDAQAKVHYFLPHLNLSDVLDEDGAAIILHAGADDYRSQPSGDAGARIACGVIR